MSKITNDSLTKSGTRCFIAVPVYGNSGRQRVKAYTVSNKVIGLPYIIWLSGESLHCTNISVKIQRNLLQNLPFQVNNSQNFLGRGTDTSTLGASIKPPRECLATYGPDDWACLLCTAFTTTVSITLIHTCRPKSRPTGRPNTLHPTSSNMAPGGRFPNFFQYHKVKEICNKVIVKIIYHLN